MYSVPGVCTMYLCVGLASDYIFSTLRVHIIIAYMYMIAICCVGNWYYFTNMLFLYSFHGECTSCGVRLFG